MFAKTLELHFGPISDQFQSRFGQSPQKKISKSVLALYIEVTLQKITF